MKITLIFISVGLDSEPSFVWAIILVTSTDPRWTSHFSLLWDNEITIHPGSKPETLMLTWWWYWYHKSPNADDSYLSVFLMFPCYCALPIDHRLSFQLLHGVNMVHLWNIGDPIVYLPQCRQKCRSENYPFLQMFLIGLPCLMLKSKGTSRSGSVPLMLHSPVTMAFNS